VVTSTRNDAPPIVLLGAGGFVGQAFVRRAGSRRLKAVMRKPPKTSDASRPGVTWHAADLASPGSLDGIIDAGDVVVNLVYAGDRTEAENLALLDGVIDAAIRRRAAALIHVSTAVVAGETPEHRVTESTKCVPVTSYQHVKLALETRALQAVGRGLDVAVLRPTAVVGPGGRNLVTLANALLRGSALTNYVRAALFGRRPMHLVPVATVVDAVLFLAGRAGSLNGAVYIVSSHDDPDNNFESVERLLRHALGLSAPRGSVPHLPFPLLSFLLKTLRRAENDMHRVYDGTHLRDAGFRATVTVADAVREFGESLR
jgi:nucleoside-diphosphate-sugar epimerase